MRLSPLSLQSCSSGASPIAGTLVMVRVFGLLSGWSVAHLYSVVVVVSEDVYVGWGRGKLFLLKMLTGGWGSVQCTCSFGWVDLFGVLWGFNSMAAC